MIKGIWACSDPRCSAVPAEFRYEGRRLGRLYGIPATTCDCGARVLELLYCDQCGDVSLGGFVMPIGDQAPLGGWYLSALPPALGGREQLPASRRAYGEYMWYAPVPPPADVQPWSHTAPARGGRDPRATRMRFLAARFNPKTGFLEPNGGGAPD